MNPSRDDRVKTLMAALTIDGSGVAALTGLAVSVAATNRTARKNKHGLAATAVVGMLGFGLAVTAVRLASHEQTKIEPSNQVLGIARRLIVAGLTVNTVGCAAVIGTSRRAPMPATAAVLLLVTGDILSWIYHHQLTALENVARGGQVTSPPELTHIRSKRQP